MISLLWHRRNAEKNKKLLLRGIQDVPIQVETLTYTYAAGTPLAKTALADLSFTIVDGSCVAIIGVTGSGKSTLVQHFNGLLRPTSGRVVVNAIDVGAKGADLAKLRRTVGLVFQSPETQLFASSVFEDVAFGPRQMGMSQAKVARLVEEALRIVGLPQEEFGRRDPFALSGGQMRRVALAGVLAMEPTILILDEPTAGLDGRGRAELYRFLSQLRAERGTTILLVSHDMAEVAMLAERMLVLHQGRLVLEGRPRDLFKQAHRLVEWGLDVPALSQMSALLVKHGFPLSPEVLSLDEMAQAILAGRVGSQPSSGAPRDVE
jgi:energy-coupling factor transport system ATP-binding protein